MNNNQTEDRMEYDLLIRGVMDAAVDRELAYRFDNQRIQLTCEVLDQSLRVLNHYVEAILNRAETAETLVKVLKNEATYHGED